MFYTYPIVKVSSAVLSGAGRFTAQGSKWLYAAVLASFTARGVNSICVGGAMPFQFNLDSSDGVTTMSFETLNEPSCMSFSAYPDDIEQALLNFTICVCPEIYTIMAKPAYSARMGLTTITKEEGNAWDTPVSITNKVVDGKCIHAGRSLCRVDAGYCRKDHESLLAVVETTGTDGADLYLFEESYSSSSLSAYMTVTATIGGVTNVVYQGDMATDGGVITDPYGLGMVLSYTPDRANPVNPYTGLDGQMLIKYADGSETVENVLQELANPQGGGGHLCSKHEPRPIHIALKNCESIFDFNIIDNTYHYVYTFGRSAMVENGEPALERLVFHYPDLSKVIKQKVKSGDPFSTLQYMNLYKQTDKGFESLGYEYSSVESTSWGIPSSESIARNRFIGLARTASACNALRYFLDDVKGRARCLTRLFLRMTTMDGTPNADTILLASYRDSELNSPGYTGSWDEWDPTRTSLFDAMLACTDCANGPIPFVTGWNSGPFGTYGGLNTHQGISPTIVATYQGYENTNPNTAYTNLYVGGLRDTPCFWGYDGYTKNNDYGSDPGSNAAQVFSIMPLCSIDGSAMEYVSLNSAKFRVFNHPVMEHTCLITSLSKHPIVVRGYGFLDCIDWPLVRYPFGGSNVGNIPDGATCPVTIDVGSCVAPVTDGCNLGRGHGGSFKMIQYASGRGVDSSHYLEAATREVLSGGLIRFTDNQGSVPEFDITLSLPDTFTFHEPPYSISRITGPGYQVGDALGVVGETDDQEVSFAFPCSENGWLLFDAYGPNDIYEFAGPFDCYCQSFEAVCHNITIDSTESDITVTLVSARGTQYESTGTVDLVFFEEDPDIDVDANDTEEDWNPDRFCISCVLKGFLDSLFGGDFVGTLILVGILIVIIGVLGGSIYACIKCGSTNAKPDLKTV